MREETCCCHMAYSFRLAARDLLYASSHRQDNTYHSLCYASRGPLAGMRNSSMGTGGASHSSVVECLLMAQWITGGPPVLFLIPARAPTINGHRMYYPVYGMMHIKEPLLLIGKSSPCGGSGFPFSLSE